jgi:tRNA nucleotidyltransferase/poly(A) polymerase
LISEAIAVFLALGGGGYFEQVGMKRIGKAVEFQVGARLPELLGPGLSEFLHGIGSAATDPASPLFIPGGVYLVGGAVRDLVRNSRSFDIDLMVEGDGPALAVKIHGNWSELFPQFVAAELRPAKPVTFPKYRTAKLPFRGETFPGISSIDFSSSRSEIYPVPGGQPQLSPGSFNDDMLRRDFSINALALELSPEKFGSIIDVVGGVADIHSMVLRVLHDRSFVDDPARVIRGCRFAARFGYSFDPRTAELVDSALAQNLLATLPRFRLFDEFRKAMDEAQAGEIIAYLHSRGVLSAIDATLSPTEEDYQLIANARAVWESEPLDIADYTEQGKNKGRAEFWMMTCGVLYRHLAPMEYQTHLIQLGATAATASRLSLVRHLTFDRHLKAGQSSINTVRST